MKKLIPAISMALLGVAALGGSTFAWFSANKSASASGLSIKATAGSSLLISVTSSTTGFGPSASLVDDVNHGETAIEPCTIDSGNTFKKIDAETKQYVNNNGVVEGHTATYVSTTTDYQHDQCWLMYQGGTSATAYASVTLSKTGGEPQQALWDAVRVGLWDGTTMLTFDPSTLSTPTAQQSFTITAAAVKSFDVYVWVEGTDTNCKNANALLDETYNVGVDFTLTAAA